MFSKNFVNWGELMYTKVIEHSQNDVIHYVLNIPSKGHNEQSQ